MIEFKFDVEDEEVIGEKKKKRISRPPPPQLLKTIMSTSVSGLGPRKWRRTHGLQPPLHPQQAAACLFLALFSLLNFGMLLPALHSSIFLYVVRNDLNISENTG